MDNYSGVENLDLKNNVDFEYFRIICKTLCENDRKVLIQATRFYGILSKELIVIAHNLIVENNRVNRFIASSNEIEDYVLLPN